MRNFSTLGIGAISLMGATLPSLNQNAGPLPSPETEISIVEQTRDEPSKLDALKVENEYLKETLARLGEFRVDVENRYTVVEEGRHTLLAEHRKILREDVDMLKACEAESADISARLILRLELLRERQVALEEQHEKLLRRKEELTTEYGEAKKTHEHLDSRHKGELAKISQFEGRLVDYDKELAKAIAERNDAYHDWLSRW